jgi:hypothetical protein
MTVPELAEPNTGNGTNESRPVPDFRKWNPKKDSTEMGASTGNGNASSSAGKLRVWHLRLIYLKRRVFDLTGTKNSNRTDRI